MTDITRPGAITGNANVLLNAKVPNAGTLLALGYYWRGRVTFRDLTAAALTQSLDLRSLFNTARGTAPNIIGANQFNPNIFAGLFFVDLVQTFSGGGVTAATVIAGRAGATNAYLTSTNIFTGATLGYASTPAATEYAVRPFIGNYTPLLEIGTTTANVNVLTQGILDVYFFQQPMPSRRPAA